MLLSIYRAIFYPSPIMGPPSSPCILELSPYPSLSYFITASFRLLPRKLLWKKQTFLGPTELPFDNLVFSFCSSFHSYRERIGLIPNPLSPSCGLVPHTTGHVFSYFSHPTPLTELDLWERSRLASEFLSSLPFFNLPPLPSSLPDPPPSGGQESWEQSSSSCAPSI